MQVHGCAQPPPIELPATTDAKTSRKFHWEKAVAWAQESLICKDIFNQLVRESAADPEQICMATSDDCLLVSIAGDWTLKVERRFFPFEERADIRAGGIAYLNRTLEEMFVADQLKSPVRSQQFIHLPQSAHPENLDMRGPQALTSEEVES